MRKFRNDRIFEQTAPFSSSNVANAVPASALVNFAVDSLEWHLAELEARGLNAGEIQVANKNVQLASIRDRDGNTITFIGNFREEY